MEYANAVETNNFLFKSLQKVRLIPSEDVHCERNEGKWLAVSSQLQIGVAVASGSHFIGFSTAELHKLATNKHNINQEYTELKKKIVSLQQPSTIVSIGVNCDGTVLGAVVDTSNGPFVYIYDLRVFAPEYTGPIAPSHEVRISINPSAKSGCFEWNPAISDTFAASTDDNDMVVVKVDVTKLGNFSMIGEKKFGSPVTVISWSPKGKQLTVGDSLGKVTQCKPELEIVRSTMPLTDQPSPRVVGLFWLATTEWIVAYGYGPKEQEKVDAGILTIKKDKPPTLNRLHDLQYGMKDAVRSTHLYGLSLGEWNVVACASAKLSEVVIVGKESENWQTWTVDENSRFDLPVCSNGKPSFPIGLAVDRSGQQDVILTDDGSQRCPAMPIVIVLTSDGILSSCHAISAYPQHTSCQITPQPLSIDSSIRVSTPSAPTHTVSTSTSSQATTKPSGTGLFGGAAPATSLFGATAAATPAPATGGLFGSASPATTTAKPLFGAAPATGSSLFGGAPSTTSSIFGGASPQSKPAGGSLFGGTAATSAATPTPATPSGGLFGSASVPSTTSPSNGLMAAAGVQSGSLFGGLSTAAQGKPASPVSSNPPASLATEKLIAKDREEDKAAVLAAQAKRAAEAAKAEKEAKARAQADLILRRMKIGEKFKEIQKEIEYGNEESVRLSQAIAHTSPVADPLQKYAREVMGEMKTLISDVEGEQNMVIHMGKQVSNRVGDNATLVMQTKDGGSMMNMLKERDSFDRDERMKRMEERLAECKLSMGSVKKTMEVLEKAEKSPAPLCTWSQVDVQTDAKLSEVLTRITVISRTIRGKTEKLERDVRLMEREKKKLAVDGDKAKVVEYELPVEKSVQFVNPGDISGSREALRMLCKSRSSTVRRCVVTPSPSLPNTSFNQKQTKSSDLARVQQLLEESLRLTPSASPDKKTVMTFTVGTQSVDSGPVAPSPKVESAAKPPPVSSQISTSLPFGKSPTVPVPSSVASLFGKSTTTPAAVLKPSGLFGTNTVATTGTSTTPIVPQRQPLTLTDSIDVQKEKEEKEREKEAEVSTTATISLKPVSTEKENETTTVVKKEEVSLPSTTVVDESAKAKETKSIFSFGGSESPSTTPSSTSTPLTSTTETKSIFGTPAVSTSATSTTSPAKPSFSFATGSTTAAAASSTDTKPSFSFGQPAATSQSATSPETKPTFSFSNAAASQPATTGAKPSFSFAAAAAAVATDNQPKSVFGGSGTATGEQSSIFGSKPAGGGGGIFGGGAASPPSQSSSLFGGPAAKPSIFATGGTQNASTGGGLFGGGGGSGTTSGSFSFKKEEPKPTFSFNKPSGGSGGGFAAAAAAVAANDDGMMEDNMGGNAAQQQQQQSGSIFGGGGGFMSGLGSSSAQSSAPSKSIFGSGMNLSNPSGGGGQAFGSLFKGSGNQQQQQQPASGGSIFGGGGAAQQQQQAPSIFGGAPKFGGAPSFGAKPSFGGASPQQTSIFGGGGQQQQQQQSGGGFSSFAGKSSGFAGLAASSPQAGSSIFGGPQKPTGGSFSSWR